MPDALDDLLGLDTPLILFVGEEVPRAAGLPSRQALAEKLLQGAEDHVSARQYRELQGLLEESELAGLFSELERALTPAGFGRAVERSLDDDDAEVPALAKALASMRPRLRGVITPNLDHLLERAFEGRLAVHARPVADLPSRTDWLLKLHGTLRDRSTWVLTDEQRAHALYRDPVHQGVFRSLFLSHPVLFVGTPPGDEVLADVVAEIQALAGGQPPQHWALLPDDDVGPVRRRKLAAAGIDVIPYADEAERAALLARLAGEAPSPKAPAAKPAAAPTSAPPPPKSAAPPPKSAAPPPAPAAQSKRSILFLAANPAGTDPLRLDRELRIIREAIERSRGRESLHLEIRLAATVHDLRRALLDTHYDVVHVSGHGEQEGLILEDERGDNVQVPRQAVARLFGRYAPPSGRLQCVVLNACWTLATGESTAMDVPFTVAMDGPISDAAAMEFSRGFYDALGAGRGFSDAYAEGRSCVELAAPDSRFDSVLLQP